LVELGGENTVLVVLVDVEFAEVPTGGCCRVGHGWEVGGDDEGEGARLGCWGGVEESARKLDSITGSARAEIEEWGERKKGERESEEEDSINGSQADLEVGVESSLDLIWHYQLLAASQER
jgi:hypothetical protein